MVNFFSIRPRGWCVCVGLLFCGTRAYMTHPTYMQTWADIVSARNRNQIFRYAHCLGAERHLVISGNYTEIFLYRLVVIMDEQH